MTETKPIWASKTLWTNIVALIATIAAGRGFDIPAAQQAEIVVGILTFVNILLRFATSKGVTLK